MGSRNKSITSHSIFPLTLLYDGDCTVCALEMDDLRGRDRERRLIFVDIAQPQFDPSPYGTQLPQLRSQIHAVRPDGRMLRGVSVLHLAYAAVGRGWMFAPVRWPLLKPMVDAAYRVLSRHRKLISRTAGPLLFWVRDRRARGTLQRMQDSCLQADDAPASPAAPTKPMTPAEPPRAARPPRPARRTAERPPFHATVPAIRPASIERRAPAGAKERSSLWQDTLPAINPPSSS
jgi:predicted DCC family thiol-disulfide oxidoreductase YuxK